MKKFLSFVLVAVMLLSTVLLTSCEGLVDTVSNLANNFLEKEARTQISEIEWQKMFMLENYTVINDINGMHHEFLVTKNAIRWNTTGTDGLNAVCILDLNRMLIMSNSSKGWLATSMSDLDSNALENLGVDLKSLFSNLKYEELVYDEVTKAYTGKYLDTLYELHFADGVLASAVILSTSEKNGYYEIKNVGTTVVEFPTSYITIDDGKVDPNSADKNARTKITEREWNSINSATNYTSHWVGLSGQYGVDVISKITSDGKHTVYYVSDYEISNTYKAIIDGYYYSLQKSNNGEYVAYQESAKENSLLANTYGLDQEISFDDLVYDENARYYVATLVDRYETYKVYFYFENGTITKMIIDIPDFGELEITFSDWGTTKLDIPNYTIYSDTEVNEWEWNYNLSFTNFTISAVTTQATGTMMQSGNVCRVVETLDGDVQTYYYVEQDGAVYIVTNTDGEWQGKKVYYMNTMQPWPFQIMEASELPYDFFTYDPSLKAYVGVEGDIRVELYFVDDVIRSAKIFVIVDGEYMEMTYEFSDLGTTPELEYPDFVIIDDRRD